MQKTVSVKLTQDEIAGLDSQAKKHGITRHKLMCKVLHEAGLNKPLPMKPELQQLDKTTSQLRRLGLNLNQALRLCHKHNQIHHQLNDQLLANLKNSIDELSFIFGAYISSSRSRTQMTGNLDG